MSYDAAVTTTATVFDAEDNGVWTLADITGEGSPHLVYIKTRDTESGKVELFAASRSSDFQENTLSTATAFEAFDADPLSSGHVFLMRDWTGDGRADLVLVKTRDTPSGKVELHVADAGSGYQEFALQAETCFDCQESGAWTMSHPRGDQLVFVKTQDCESGNVEVHAAGRGSGYESLDRHDVTSFAAEESGTWCLAPRDAGDDGEGGGGIPDLYYIKTRDTESGVVEVHAATAESGWQDRAVSNPTSFSQADDGHWLVADLTGQHLPDLVYIQVRSTDSGKVEVHTNEG